MRVTLVRLTALFIATSFANEVRADGSGIPLLEVNYFLDISGTNVPHTNSVPLDPATGQPSGPVKGNGFVGTGDLIDVSTDIIKAKGRASAYANNQQGAKLLGAQIEGSVEILRPANYPDSTGYVSVTATATAKYDDYLAFYNPDSKPMHVEGFVKIPGTMDTDGATTGSQVQGNAISQLTLSGTGMVPINYYAQILPDGTKTLPPIEDHGINSFSIDVQPGELSLLEFIISLSGSAIAGGPLYTTNDEGTAIYMFDAYYDKSLDWGGITSVTNSLTGEPITDWSVTSESGFDYTQVFPVPEPTTAALALAATLCLAFRRHRN